MTSGAATPEAYLKSLPPDRQAVMRQLRQTIVDNLPKGFEETMSYGMIGYVVPHQTYQPGYHCDPKLPLPFIHIAAQKNFYALYHGGLYAQSDLLKWFTDAYPNHSSARLDMGKSCVRFKKAEHIPHSLLAELCQKISVDQWISLYESVVKKS